MRTCANPLRPWIFSAPKSGDLSCDHSNIQSVSVEFVVRWLGVLPVRKTATADVRLEWQTSGQPVQLEKAESVDGPYVPLPSMATNSIYVDKGILTGSGHAFYRLSQKAY